MIVDREVLHQLARRAAPNAGYPWADRTEKVMEERVETAARAIIAMTAESKAGRIKVEVAD